MVSLELSLLGRFEVRLQSGPAIELPTKKAELLLAYLALPPGKKHPRDKLAVLLWSDRGDEQARDSLRHALMSLRKALQDVEASPLVAERETVSLDPAAVEVDAATFEALVATGTPKALEQACTLYQGGLLEGESVRDPPFEEWLFYERGKLRDLALGAFERLLDYQREAGGLKEAIKTAKRLLELNPAHEKTHRALMRLYADQGRRAAALEQYQHCRGALKRELDVEPRPETEQLYQEILKRPGRPPRSISAPSLKQTPRRRAAIGGGALLLAAGVALGFWQLYPAPAPPPAETPALELPDKPSIAVLPFDNLSGDPEQDYLADGITDEIITELSRFHNLFVIARNSAFVYKGKAVKVQEVARELGVQYVLEGSIRKQSERLRITAQLADATSGHHVWVESYDRELKDVFAVQEEVAQAIAATLVSGHWAELTRAEVERAKRKAPGSWQAYEYYLVGIDHKRRFTKKANLIAQQMLARAIELDPEFSRAHVALAWSYFFDWWYGWSDTPDISADRALESAKMAVALDETDANAHWVLGAVYLQVRHQYEEGIAQYQKALALNPNNADILAEWGGYVLPFLGRAEEGVESVQRAMRLNPHYPDWYNWGLGIAYYNARLYGEAIAALQRVQIHTIDSRSLLAASYAQLDREEEARAQAAELVKIDPQFSSAHWAEKQYYQNQADLDHYLEGLRQAGLPE